MRYVSDLSDRLTLSDRSDEMRIVKVKSNFKTLENMNIEEKDVFIIATGIHLSMHRRLSTIFKIVEQKSKKVKKAKKCMK